MQPKLLAAPRSGGSISGANAPPRMAGLGAIEATNLAAWMPTHLPESQMSSTRPVRGKALGSFATRPTTDRRPVVVHMSKRVAL